MNRPLRQTIRLAKRCLLLGAFALGQSAWAGWVAYNDFGTPSRHDNSVTRIGATSTELKAGSGSVEKTGKGSGMGSFALLADNSIVHGPADRSGGVLTEASLSGDKVASHTDALDMIVDSGTIFMLTANKTTAMTRSNRRGLWSQSVEAGNALALAGKTLFVGSRDKVSAFNGAIVSFGQASNQPSAWIFY